MKKSLRNFLPFLSLLLLPFYSSIETYPLSADALDTNPIGLKLYQIKSPASFHTVLQENFISHGNRNIQNFAKANAELSKPDALRFSWEAKNLEKSANPNYSFKISENQNFENARIYQTKNTYIDVYNLKLATRYYYQVSTTFNEESSISEVKYFSTEKSVIRNLNIDGVMNARDLGGWRNREGKFMVKQGLLFRSGPFNASNAKTYQVTITSSGLAETKQLGIKTEIDLRRTDNGETGQAKKSPLGTNVKYINAPINWDIPESALVNADNIASIKTVFETLGDANNYPLIFHCTAGADRTGLIAFLINGLLGVSEADLYRDYLFTNFSNVSWIRQKSNITNEWLKTIKKENGFTLQDQITHFLRKIGVSLSDLVSLYNIMQEEGYRP